MSTDELLANVLQILETCLPVNHNSCEKLVLSLQSPIMLEDHIITTSFSFFIADVNSLSCEFDNFVFKPLHCIIFVLLKIIISIDLHLHVQNFYGAL